MSVSVSYDKKNRTATVTVNFNTTEQIEKEGLTKEVIENHLLTEAASLLSLAANQALNPVDVDAEALALKAKIDQETQQKKSVALSSSNVIAVPKAD